MDKFLGGRTRRRRLVLPAWWYQRCSVAECTVPLNPPSNLEDLDEWGCTLRTDDMLVKNISNSQVCSLCRAVFCRYHLSKQLHFYARYSLDFVDCHAYPDVARLCAKCLMDVEIEFIEWQNAQLLQGDAFNMYHYQLEYHRRRYGWKA
jgi:hypothetical protein